MNIEEIKSQLKGLKEQKGRIARQFKSVESGTEEHAALIAAMQEVSTEVKTLESALKDCLNQQQEPSPTSVRKVLPPSQFNQPQNTYGESITLNTLTASDDLSSWWAFVDASANDSLYHSRAIWQFYGTQPYTHRELIVAVNRAGEIVGGLPFVTLATPVFGKFTVSQPFFNYGGPLTGYRDVFEALLQACKKKAQSGDDKYVEIRTTVKTPLPASLKKVSMLRQLPTSSEKLDEELGAKVRAQVKKAEENQPTFKVGGSELLKDFYAVFARNMRDLGTPVNGIDFFEALCNELRHNIHIAMVYIDGKPVGTGFLTTHRNMMEIPWASTVRDVNKMNINMWMYDNILKFAITQKVEWFDFGRSTKDAGTYRFKKQWGARPFQHYWYSFAQEEESESSLNPDNPKFKLAINVWQRLPVWLTKRIGPFLSRQLP
ncbi:FemAB family PEP-CTERM system-associated protein [Alteromonas pelagimontana]|uniref:FemAB family PEP-CTERM system-associated protein n=1 Tax=Alteromonas pelagimontana TaxID=1858656 RepID=A0A6M4MIN0_9ALTE|nr:FemAB family XrtA/PEP-CTERM system-associated protein [Alteromonas pelagimontana]QJR81966.1 FemAB family PEP-CTERM system-associated protein [Alteromonas pelagimontana]